MRGEMLRRSDKISRVISILLELFACEIDEI